jgi:hypothetical protein
VKVGRVGSGFVGATAGYALVRSGVGREVVLAGKSHARAEAEADDIRHAVPFAHLLDIRAGGYEDLEGCRAVQICAGVGQKPSETRPEGLSGRPDLRRRRAGGAGGRLQPGGRDDACPTSCRSWPARTRRQGAVLGKMVLNENRNVRS